MSQPVVSMSQPDVGTGDVDVPTPPAQQEESILDFPEPNYVCGSGVQLTDLTTLYTSTEGLLHNQSIYHGLTTRAGHFAVPTVFELQGII